MILVPEDYEGLNLASNEKMLISILRRSLSDEFILFIEVNPTGVLKISFVLLHKHLGVICLTIDEAEPPSIDVYFPIIKPQIWDKQEKILKNKLSREKTLLNIDGSLKVNFKWLYFFPNIERQKSSEQYNTFNNSQCIFKDELLNVFKDENSIIDLFGEIKLDEGLNREEFNSLGFVIAPHYYIPQQVSIVEDESKQIDVIESEQIKIDYKQREVRALSLDIEQINIINQINYGEQLLLACAGSGKSALLIAKAFKIASVYPHKKVLITCFNSNLANYYQWRIDVAGFSIRNVECRTFHSLTQNLLAENNIINPYNRSSSSYFDDVFRLVESEFNKGKIKPRYDAVFIDEVQIFKKEWYMLSYNLLNSKNKEKHLFVIAGDKSQNVNNNIDKGLAPWQVSEKGFPNFETQTIRIETNYRNCKEINDYINNFVSVVKNYFDVIGYDFSKKDDLFLRGQSIRSGNSPLVHRANRHNEIKSVFEFIDELHYKKKVPLSEIAILIPQRQFKNSRYFILTWLKDEFNRRYMDYTLLLNDEEDYTRYGERKGVSICTIESALGLDFEAVIMCGLYPLGFYNKAYTKEQLMDDSVPVEIIEQRRENFFKNINQLYTGMTRARNHLFIILSQNETKNIYSDILVTSQVGEE